MIVVPAFNEEHSIELVLHELHRYNPGNWHVLVVNDSSNDRTPQITEGLGYAMLDLPVNLGIGGCVQAGFLFGIRNGFHTMVQFDSDGQHLASEVPALLQALASSDADVAVGSRFIESFSGQFRSTFTRRLGIRVIRAANTLLTHNEIKDPTSGFRAFNRSAMELLAAEYPNHYPEPESLILLHRRGFRVIEVPTLMNPRLAGKSSIRKRVLFYMLHVLLGMLVESVRPRKPRVPTEDTTHPIPDHVHTGR